MARLTENGHTLILLTLVSGVRSSTPLADEPMPRGPQVGEGQAQLHRRVLERAEESFGVRVVVPDVRSAEGGTMPSHCNVANRILDRLDARISITSTAATAAGRHQART